MQNIVNEEILINKSSQPPTDSDKTNLGLRLLRAIIAVPPPFLSVLLQVKEVNLEFINGSKVIGSSRIHVSTRSTILIEDIESKVESSSRLLQIDREFIKKTLTGG